MGSMEMEEPMLIDASASAPTGTKRKADEDPIEDERPSRRIRVYCCVLADIFL